MIYLLYQGALLLLRKRTTNIHLPSTIKTEIGHKSNIASSTRSEQIIQALSQWYVG